MRTIEIKNIDGVAIFRHTAENNTVKLTVETAVSCGVSLAKANLKGTDLRGANLSGANYIEDILRKWGLCAQSTKHNINMCKSVFNAFERDMQRNIATREQQDNFNEEFDKLYDALSKYFLTCVDDDKNNKTKGDKDDK